MGHPNQTHTRTRDQIDVLRSENLFHVVAAVGQVELPPLPCRQRPEHRMVQNHDARAITLFALRDDFVHGVNLRTDFGDYLFRRHAPGNDLIRGLPSFGKIAKLGDRGGRHSLLESGNAAQRLPRLQAALKSLLRSGVGQIEMLEYLRRAPLPFRLACQFLDAHVSGRGSNRLTQTFQIRIHGPSDCSL